MRGSGILMHITSLPGPYGVGTMGKYAYAFVDFLKKAGQSYWQVLPLTPTGYGNSPYQSYSTFAGNPYLIDLDLLVEEGLLFRQEIAAVHWNTDENRVDFGLLYANRLQILRLAFNRFSAGMQFEAFCRENSGWLPDYSLFMALKEHNGGAPWYAWDDGLKYRQADALWQARLALQEDIRFYQFIAYVFDKQWRALKEYANLNGISIIGDVPIYVPMDSVDVWANPELFQLNEDLTPKCVAGCPPDAFTEDGQLWGNPLYNWDAIASDEYVWWLHRLAAAGKIYDIVRLDHFRAFEAYWSVPYGDATARNGQWIKGPCMEFIDTVKKALPQYRFIAEDLGFLTQEVLDMRDASGYPGMKVLQFAFDSGESCAYLPHNYTRNSVCYTGTHDNMTVCQWLDSLEEETASYARAYMGLSDAERAVWSVIRTAYRSVSDVCIVQMQDYLELGGEGRMNFPGKMSDENWTWRASEDSYGDDLANKIYQMSKIYDRLGSQKYGNQGEMNHEL